MSEESIQINEKKLRFFENHQGKEMNCSLLCHTFMLENWSLATKKSE